MTIANSKFEMAARDAVAGVPFSMNHQFFNVFFIIH